MNAGEHIFEAVAFRPGVDSESISGRIVVTRWRFCFQSAEVTLEIPLERLHARAGEGADERLFFTDDHHPEWQIITDDFGIIEIPEIAAVDHLAEKLSREASRSELRRRLRMLAYVAGICALLVCLAQFTLSLMVRSLLANLPPRWEQELGDGIMNDVREEMNLVDEPNRIAMLAALANPLTRTIGNGKVKFSYYLAEEEEPNAFALPGGHVVVTTGLLKLAETPEEVLGVLAHEVAHVTQKHGVRKAIASAGPFLVFRVFLGGNRSGLVRLAGAASDLLIAQSFSQEFETEADDVGWTSLVQAGIDPRGMIVMFEKLRFDEQSRHGIGLKLPQAFQSHPALETRISRLKAKWRKTTEKTQFQNLTALKAQLAGAAGLSGQAPAR